MTVCCLAKSDFLCLPNIPSWKDCMVLFMSVCMVGNMDKLLVVQIFCPQSLSFLITGHTFCINYWYVFVFNLHTLLGTVSIEYSNQSNTFLFSIVLGFFFFFAKKSQLTLYMGSAVFSISLYEANFQLQIITACVGLLGCRNSGSIPAITKI